MSKPMGFYWGSDMARTLEKMKSWSMSGKLSCAHHPLINIPLENVVVDELHLMLRVTGQYIIHIS